MTVDELAAGISDGESPPGERGRDAVDRIATEMHHTHLPRLAEAGYVEWDREDDVLRRGPRFDEVAPLIELLVVHEDELPAGWP